MSLVTKDIDIFVSRQEFEDSSGRGLPVIEMVNGDTLLFAFHFKERFEDIDSDFNLSEAGTPSALRLTIKSNRTTAATSYSFQDAFNTGLIPAFENLAEGKVTWLVALTDAAITTAIDDDESTPAFLEIAWTDFNGVAQTLAQIPGLIFAQLDDGAPGSPPPTSPTFLTAVEIAALIKDIPAELVAIDLTTAATSDIITLSDDAVPETAHIRITALTGKLAMPDIEWLVDDGTILHSEVTMLPDEGEIDGLMVFELSTDNSKVILAGRKIQMRVANAGTSTTHVATAYFNGRKV